MSKQEVRRYPDIGDRCAACQTEDGNDNQLVWQRGEVWEAGGRQWLCENCLGGRADTPAKNYYFVYTDTQFGPQREGGFESRSEAEALQKKMAKRGIRKTWVIQEPLYLT